MRRGMGAHPEDCGTCNGPNGAHRRILGRRTSRTLHVLDANPVLDIKAPKLGKRLPHVLDVDQTTQILDIAQYAERDPHAIRDKAIMELLYSSALRVTEL